MRAQGEGGSMVMLSSKTGLDASKSNSAYNATKAGELHLMRGWALELGPDGIRVNAVAPGNVFEGSKIWNPEYIKAAAKKKGIQPEEVIPYYTFADCPETRDQAFGRGRGDCLSVLRRRALHYRTDAGGGRRTGDGAMNDTKQLSGTRSSALRRHAGEPPRCLARALRAVGRKAPPGHQLPHPYQRILQRLPLALRSRLAGRARRPGGSRHQ